MGTVEQEPQGAFAYTDAEGRPTDDPAAAAAGEFTEHDAHGRPRRRIRFWLDREALPWLPVSEPAFLLWVLIGLVAVWLVVAVILL